MTVMSKHRSCPLVPAKGMSRSAGVGGQVVQGVDPPLIKHFRLWFFFQQSLLQTPPDPDICLNQNGYFSRLPKNTSDPNNQSSFFCVLFINIALTYRANIEPA